MAELASKHDALLGCFGTTRRAQQQGAGFVLVTERALTEHNHRIAQIDRQLAVIKRDAAVINQHCTASDDEFHQAVQRYRQEYCKAVEQAMGLAMSEASRRRATANGKVTAMREFYE